MAKQPSFPGGLDLVAQLNLCGPRDFLLQLEEELEIFVRSHRKELQLPPLARRYQELLLCSVRRFKLRAEASSESSRGWSDAPWKILRTEEPPSLPKLSLAEFLRLQRRGSAPPGVFSEEGASQDLNEEAMVRRLRLRLWAALLCCNSMERAVQVDTLMAPAVEPVEPLKDYTSGLAPLDVRKGNLLKVTNPEIKAAEKLEDSKLSDEKLPVHPAGELMSNCVKAEVDVPEATKTWDSQVKEEPDIRVKVERTTSDVDDGLVKVESTGEVEERKMEDAPVERNSEIGRSLVKVERTNSEVESLVKVERMMTFSASDEFPLMKAEMKREGDDQHPHPDASHGLQELMLNESKEETECGKAAGEVKAESEADVPVDVKVRQELADEMPNDHETPGLVRCGSVPSIKEELMDETGFAKLEDHAEEPMSPEEQDLREALRAAFERVKRAARRWNEEDVTKEEETTDRAKTVHCFRRFSPSLVPGRAYLRDSRTAPWPSVKLQRSDTPKVVWRPEWSLPHFQGPGSWEDGASMGGLFSFALEPSNVSFGEGFEVNLRDEPGPTESGAEEDLQRLPNDFLLTFSRSFSGWHLTAGTRGRPAAPKMVPDSLFSSKVGQRQMFWVACVEGHDGKHYVLVGAVPGMLSEHFFVAKVARQRPLTHVGFSYLPPSGVDIGAGTLEPLWIESITIYPHGLSGELPFISHRYLEVVKEEPSEGTENTSGPFVAEVLLEATGTQDIKSEMDEDVTPRLVLLSQKVPGAEAENRARLEHWCSAARRELGLPPLEVKVRSPSSAKKRRRVTSGSHVSRAGNVPSESALSSWGPSTTTPRRKMGPYEDSLRHLS